jgi:hypothetical protein
VWNWKLESRDKPLVYALLILALTLFATPLLSRFIPPQHAEAKNNSNPQPDSSPFWAVIEAAGTAIIAIFGIAQYRDGKKSGERQLRAYMTISKASIDEVLGEKWISRVEAKNTGLTPAREATSLVQCKIAEYPLPNGHVFPSIKSAFPGGRSVVAPGDPLYLTSIVHGNEAKPSIQNKKAVYLFGQILYRDVFGYQRHTNFRFFVCEGITTGGTGPNFAHEGNDIC